MEKPNRKPARGKAREKLLEAARLLIRAQGFAGTTVDELCTQAGVTKGAFFHHFATKNDLAVAAAEYWSETTGELFEQAPYHAPEEPLDRVLAYVDFRKALLAGPLEEITCLVGTMTQEVYGTAPEIRDACADSIFGHAQTLQADIAAAAEARGVTPPHGPEGLAAFTQAAIQGGFILAKAKNDPGLAVQTLDHLRRYIELLFDPAKGKGAA